ncbi:very long chain fatty acid elongase 7 isoform X1 [Anabrus simplex]|uniref:very long chain fatty acid elongase 7 isoform X1 n=1 Tax=Anabrus simplex TaxID=316456 RepID=UPI0034DCF74D
MSATSASEAEYQVQRREALRSMMDALHNFASNYDYVVNQRGDPRVKEWLLMASPWPVVTLIILYLYVVLHLGPRIMDGRQPYSFRKTIIALNMLQVLLNGWVVKEVMMMELNLSYSLRCQPVDYSTSPRALRVARAIWVYLLLKVLDLSDTLLMVLRKKYNQMTFLHIFHHATTLALAWCIVKYGAGGLASFGVTLNSLIHVIMYAYYLLAALGPRLQPYLWWKKYLTSFQIVQLCSVAFYNFFALYTGCNYPKPLMVVFIPLISVNLVAFYHFYRNSYSKKAK